MNYLRLHGRMFRKGLVVVGRTAAVLLGSQRHRGQRQEVGRLLQLCGPATFEMMTALIASQTPSEFSFDEIVAILQCLLIRVRWSASAGADFSGEINVRARQ